MMEKLVVMVKRQISIAGKANKQCGFSYIVVLLLIIIVSISAQVASTLSSTLIQREKEQELLFRGNAYVQAIKSYYYAIPNKPSYPSRLSDLENDPRFLHKPHIRKLYKEPITGKWSLITNRDGRISGVVSSSLKQPIKTHNFSKKYKEFENSKHYSDWRFLFSP